MKNLFSSPPEDLQKFIQRKFDILNANLLYVTHQVDDIKMLVTRIITDGKLQTQVEDFYEESGPPPAEEDSKQEVVVDE